VLLIELVLVYYTKYDVVYVLVGCVCSGKKSACSKIISTSCSILANAKEVELSNVIYCPVMPG